MNNDKANAEEYALDTGWYIQEVARYIVIGGTAVLIIAVLSSLILLGMRTGPIKCEDYNYTARCRRNGPTHFELLLEELGQ